MTNEETIRANALQAAARTVGVVLVHDMADFMSRVSLFETYIRLGMDAIQGMLTEPQPKG